MPVSDTRLRVAYVVKRFPRLSETFVLNECLELERQGIAVDIYSLFTPPSEPRHDLLAKLQAKIVYLDQLPDDRESGADVDLKFGPFFSGKSALARTGLIMKAKKVAKLARASGCAHLHAHFGNDATTVAAIAAHRINVGYSFTAHAKDIYHTYVDEISDSAMRRAKMRHASFVVTVTDYNKAHLARLAGADEAAKIVRLYNGIDLSRFSFVEAAERDLSVVLAVGRLVEKKGYGDLVAAVAGLKTKRPDVRCIICGEGSLRERIEAQVAALDLGSHVTLLGAVDQSEIIAQMRRATALVLPAVVTDTGDRDALPTVLLEAQAMGLPVISTPVCGIPEIITHEETGLLVPERRPDLLSDAMLRLIKEEDLRARLAVNGRRSAERNFDLATSASTLLGLFRRSIENRVKNDAPQQVFGRTWHETTHAVSGA